MILTIILRAGLLSAIVFLFFVGIVALKPAQVQAQGLGFDIVCNIVFPHLNATGDPIPHLDPSCPSTPPPPPPPPPPPTPAACDDGIDNDGDSFADENDPNCHTDNNPSNATSYDPNKTSETGALPACLNNQDDDGDGKEDFPADPGCTSEVDTDESDGGGTPSPQCSDGLDNDGDGKTDFPDDPGCSSAAGTDESDEGGGTTSPVQCADGLDNDNDGVIDLADGGCTDASDNDETDNNSNGGGGGGGGGGGSKKKATTTPMVLGAATTTPLYTIEEIAACDTYLTAFIRDGQANDIEQVTRLQRFLNDFEGASLQIDGVYGTSTLAAVHAFQTKYAADILTPWGIGESTGFVYLTTRKKVNEIFCNFTKNFPPTLEEQQKVDAARTASASIAPTDPRSPSAPSKPSAEASPAAQPGAGEGASGTQKGLLDFLKGFFGW